MNVCTKFQLLCDFFYSFLQGTNKLSLPSIEPHCLGIVTFSIHLNHAHQDLYNIIKLPTFANQGSVTIANAAFWWPLGVLVSVKLNRP